MRLAEWEFRVPLSGDPFVNVTPFFYPTVNASGAAVLRHHGGQPEFLAQEACRYRLSGFRPGGVLGLRHPVRPAVFVRGLLAEATLGRAAGARGGGHQLRRAGHSQLAHPPHRPGGHGASARRCAHLCGPQRLHDPGGTPGAGMVEAPDRQVPHVPAGRVDRTGHPAVVGRPIRQGPRLEPGPAHHDRGPGGRHEHPHAGRAPAHCRALHSQLARHCRGRAERGRRRRGGEPGTEFPRLGTERLAASSDLSGPEAVRWGQHWVGGRPPEQGRRL